MIQLFSFSEAGSRFHRAEVTPLLDAHDLELLTVWKVAGWSMFPTLQRGDELILDSIAHPRNGDIVVYREGPSFVCHRIASFGTDGRIRTKGDNTEGPGETILRSAILGTVQTIRRQGSCFLPRSAPSPSLLSRLRARRNQRLPLSPPVHRLYLLSLLARLKKVTWVHRLLSQLINRYTRIWIGQRAPLQLLGAYQLTGRSMALGDPRQMLEQGPLATKTIVFQARLGPYVLGHFDPKADRMQIRRSAQGLGLEAYFHRLAQTLDHTDLPSAQN